VPRPSPALSTFGFSRPADIMVRTTADAARTLQAGAPEVMVERSLPWTLSVSQPDVDRDGRADIAWTMRAGASVTMWIWVRRDRETP
jgi:hypothetical protein